MCRIPSRLAAASYWPGWCATARSCASAARSLTLARSCALCRVCSVPCALFRLPCDLCAGALCAECCVLCAVCCGLCAVCSALCAVLFVCCVRANTAHSVAHAQLSTAHLSPQ